MRQRRGRDSNPRTSEGPSAIFKTAAFNHSATPPRVAQQWCQAALARRIHARSAARRLTTNAVLGARSHAPSARVALLEEELRSTGPQHVEPVVCICCDRLADIALTVRMYSPETDVLRRGVLALDSTHPLGAIHDEIVGRRFRQRDRHVKTHGGERCHCTSRSNIALTLRYPHHSTVAVGSSQQCHASHNSAHLSPED